MADNDNTHLTPEEAITLATYDAAAEIWAKEHKNKKLWAVEMAEFHKLLPFGRVLEVGAGPGRDARELLGLGYDYVGTDISPGLLSLARKSNPKAVFLPKSVYELDYEREFDGFWCAAVLLHIPRLRIGEALSNIRRAMRPSATGFIAIKEGEGEEVEDGKFGQMLFTYWCNDDFKQVLSKSGFTVVSDGYRPMSERTRWLTYIVKVD